MKKYIIYILALALTPVFTSCEDWFDVQPKTTVKADDLFDTEDGFKRALIGIYTKMANNSTYGAEGTLAFMEVLSGAYTSVNSSSSNYRQASLYNYEHSGTVSKINNLWSGNYATIANINNLLENIDEKKAVFNEGIYEIVKGEALALRAYIHFDLLRNFAPAAINGLETLAIPYVDAISTVPFPQLTVNQLIDRTIEDLILAESLLKDYDPVGPTFETYHESIKGETSIDESIGKESFLLFRKERMNYYAVLGTLARVYLYRGGEDDKTEAYKYANEVINCEKFALMASEELQQTTGWDVMPNLAQEYLFSIYKRDMTEKVNETYFKTNVSSNVLSIDETRRNQYYETAKYGGVADARFTKLFNVYNNEYYLIKYEYEPTVEVKRIPLLKISEMYLIIAECMKSIDHLDKLRSARGLKGDIQLAELQDEIELEYRKEFIGEGQMFYYYKRLNKFVNDNMTDVGQFVLPIPDAEKERGLIN